MSEYKKNNKIDYINNCNICGSKLFQKIIIDHYSVEKGEPVYHTIKKCSLPFWQKILGYHYETEFDELGNEVSNYYY